jgi:hypothetical protein
VTHQRQCQDEAGTRNAAPASRPFNHEPYPRGRKGSRNPAIQIARAFFESLCFLHTRQALLHQSRACCSPIPQPAALRRSSNSQALSSQCFCCIEAVARLIYPFQYSRIQRGRSLKSIKAMLAVVAMLHMIDHRAGWVPS